MTPQDHGPRNAEKLITELNRVDNTVGGPLLLGVITFLFLGGVLAKLKFSPLLIVASMICGVMLLVLRYLLVKKGKFDVLERYGLECPRCKATPKHNIEARQALRLKQCPSCKGFYNL